MESEKEETPMSLKEQLMNLLSNVLYWIFVIAICIILLAGVSSWK